MHLSPKAYELLCLLLDSRPRALAKREVHERLWPTTFVSEATLASLVGELRDALGERGRSSRYIRTLHGFGYAFSGDVRDTGTGSGQIARHWMIWDEREIGLRDGVHVIGRDGAVSIVLASPSVSRRHARIVVSGDLVTVEDLGSKNGTFVREHPVTAPTPLADGDQIRIGSFTLTFRRLLDSASTARLSQALVPERADDTDRHTTHERSGR